LHGTRDCQRAYSIGPKAHYSPCILP
jgi:hypothetical protein